jgi:hypothetical protein
MNLTLRVCALAALYSIVCSSVALAQPAQTNPVPPDTPVNSTVPAGPDTAAAEEQDSQIEFKGYFSQSYNVNSNQPSSGLNQFRAYDFKDRDFKFDLFNLNTQYAIDKPGEAGFRLDLTAGASYPQVDSALGLFRDFNTEVSTTQFDVRQAFVSYTAENGVRVDLGKFATPIGYEIMDGVDGANPNATRTWAFKYSPYTHTGARISFPLGDQVTATALIVNGADQFRDANDSLSLGGQIAYKPTERLSFYLTHLSGLERLGTNQFQRRLWDFSANWKVHPQINFGFHTVSDVYEGNSTGPNQSSNGMTFYMQNELDEQFNLNFRYEAFNDPVGLKTGLGQRLRGFTITPEYRINENWMIRADLRFDTSDQSVYETSGAPSRQQNTFLFNNVVKF